ncbi:VOC family protein [Candidatus Nitrosocosmicus arcticus]|uniref:Glyoxalase/bleomycin resistance protein/dioxygenase n=1 Tax=Candidatus Nitrosocosmicus arcticus TaxID=2035267 RepID=A0A557SRF4_9ARCH|nr:VOC family protein [Candidatus Nitrosocosmicus arcticus]TVP39186.1 Glyoxalase/bleomycin resistance protein/dioxygenase [Candidatus Nitrosocosmicus arcticus]
MTTKIFVNLPVKDLNRAVEFFTKLGFKFNPQFTDKNATCMIISEDIFVMLLVEEFFKTFTKKEICNTSKNIEAIIALSAESKEKVDEMINKAIEAGGAEPRKPQDHGWMYDRAFEDIDGHLWEIIYMNESELKQNEKNN